MPKLKRPNPEYTAGVREERRAMRAYLKKTLKSWMADGGGAIAIGDAVDWLNARDKRTAKRKGGAGRK